MHVEVKSYFTNDKYAYKHAYYYKLIDNNNKYVVRYIFKKTYIDNIIIMPSKENRNNEYSKDSARN